jgi:hypothetical protein
MRERVRDRAGTCRVWVSRVRVRVRVRARVRVRVRVRLGWRIDARERGAREGAGVDGGTRRLKEVAT